MAPALYKHLLPVLSQLGTCQDRKPTVTSDSRLHVVGAKSGVFTTMCPAAGRMSSTSLAMSKLSIC